MSDRCERTDLLIDQCAHCRGLADPEEEARKLHRDLVSSGEWTEAKWRGKCARCGEWFREGAAIRPSAISLAWIAACCSDAEDGAA